MSFNDQRRHEELVEKIKKQVALEERAHHIVEELTEVTPTEDYLTDALQFVTYSQYTDVVIERAITKLCGYPLCGNALTAVPNQKYHISLKTKTVYDISDRKNFCSNRCFSASKYLQEQIPAEPVWLREKSQPEPIKFLAHDVNKGCAGDVVVSGHQQQVVDESQVVEMLDSLLLESDNDDDDDISDDSDTSDNVTNDPRPPRTTHSPRVQSDVSDSVQKDAKLLIQDTTSSDSDPSSKPLEWNNLDRQFPRGSFRSCVIDVSNTVPIAAGTDVKLQWSTGPDYQLTACDSNTHSVETQYHKTSSTSHPPNKAVVELTVLERVKTCLYEWKTAELVAFLLPSCCSKPIDSGNSLNEVLDESVLVAEEVSKECTESNKDDHVKLYERKVEEFYGAKPRVRFADSAKQKSENCEREILLPSVHSCSQNSLRRKIVLDKLSHVVPRLLESTSLRLSDVSTSLRDLVHCFRFTNQNIVLKSAEWTVVGFVLLKLLAVHDEAVSSAVTSEGAVKLLSSAAVTLSDVDEIICEMISTNTVLK